MPVPFGRHTPRCEPKRPGGDDERAIRTCEHLAECLDGAAVRIGSVLEASRERDVVPEGEVDHAIRHGCATAQAFRVCKITAMHLGTGGEESRGGRI